jgi:hypothetical protein
MVTKANNVAHDITENLWTDQWGITPIGERWFSGSDVGASRTLFTFATFSCVECREAKQLATKKQKSYGYPAR